MEPARGRFRRCTSTAREAVGSLAAVRVLITGSGGFVGRQLAPHLERAGHEVHGRDLELDVADAGAVAAALREIAPDAVVHLAAVSSVAASERDRALTFRVNFLGSRNVLEAVSQASPAPRLLLVSSGEVYGVGPPDAAPFDESAPLRPRSPYARSKACADLLAARHRARGAPVVRVRPFNHTGPGQSDAFVLPSFARQLAEVAAGRRPPRLRVGNLDSVRDFLDVEDVLRAYTKLLEAPLAHGLYNLASGVGRRIGDLLDALIARAGVDVAIEVDPERFRPTDRGVGDAGRLRRDTGWAPEVALETTLERIFNAAAQQVAAR